MRYSIIVPVYNVERYLPACMDSLLNQNCEDMEIILVDDGSTDGSGMLCQGYVAAFPEKVRLIRQENGGLGAARNTGLEAAQGEYVWFVDSDDVVEPTALGDLSRHIDRTGADMIVFGFSYLYEDGRVVPGEQQMEPGREPFTLSQKPWLLLSTPSACLRLWKRSLFESPDLRFPGRVWYEDLHTVPRALPRCGSILVVKDRPYQYRQRSGSIMHSPNLRRNLEVLEAVERVRGFYEKEGLMEEYGDWICALAAENMALASQRVLMEDPGAEYLPYFMGYLGQRFPDWERSPELSRLGRKKKLVLKLLEKRRYRLLRGIFRGKDLARKITGRGR